MELLSFSVMRTGFFAALVAFTTLFPSFGNALVEMWKFQLLTSDTAGESIQTKTTDDTDCILLLSDGVRLLCDN